MKQTKSFSPSTKAAKEAADRAMLEQLEYGDEIPILSKDYSFHNTGGISHSLYASLAYGDNGELEISISSLVDMSVVTKQNIELIISDSALITLFEHSRTDQFAKVAKLFTPLLKSFIYNYLEEKSCFIDTPSEGLATAYCFTDVGLFLVSSNQKTLIIYSFLPKKNYTKKEMKLEQYFLGKEFSEKPFGIPLTRYFNH